MADETHQELSNGSPVPTTDSADTEAAAPPVTPPQQAAPPTGDKGLPPENLNLHLTHTGVGKELFAITLVNLLLKVVTVGVYHFWAKTRVRSYVWSRTLFAGEPFEYTGRGVELFLGYLIAMMLVLPLIFAPQLVVMLTDNPIAVIPVVLLIYPTFLFLTGFAVYSSRRYLLSRTRWRSIRFGLSGSRARHGWLVLGHSILTALSGGLYFPVMRNRLAKNMIENMWMGDKRFRYTGDGGDLFVKVILLYLFSMIAFVGVMVGLAVVGALIYFLMLPALGFDLEKDSLAILPFIFGGGLAFLYLLIVLGAMAVGMIYLAIETRFVAESTHLEALRFKVGYSNWEFVRFNMANILLMMVTLTFAFPWVVTRTLNFSARHLSLHGDLDLDQIGQHPMGVPGTGEGLAEAFDLGSI